MNSRGNSRHFDTLRTPRQDTDRIQSRASNEFMQRFAPLCASAPPAATTPAASSPSLPSPVVHREFSCPISPNLSHARSCLSTHPTAQKVLRSESHLKQRLFGRIWQTNRGRLACPPRNPECAIRNSAKSRFPMWTHIRCVCPVPVELLSCPQPVILLCNRHWLV